MLARMPKSAQPPAEIAATILVVRGQRVLLDSDLAELYGVSTRRLNEQVRRNLQRFPKDFLIDLSNQDLAILKSHNATSSWGGRRKRPLAFTEQVAIMCVFRPMPGQYSGASRAGIPVHAGPPFRRMPGRGE